MVTTRNQYKNQSMVTRSRVIGKTIKDDLNLLHHSIHKKKIIKKIKDAHKKAIIIPKPESKPESIPELKPKSIPGLIPKPLVSVKIEEIPPPPKAEYEVNIDFDEASRAWRANKIKGPNCTFRYRKNVKKQMYKRPFLERGTEWI